MDWFPDHPSACRILSCRSFLETIPTWRSFLQKKNTIYVQLLWLLQLQIALFHSSSSSSPPGTCSRLHQSGSRGDPGVAAAAERHRRERSLRGAWMGRPEAVMAGDIGDIGDGRWRCCFEVPSKTYPADSSTRETDTLCSFRARSQPHRTGANTLRAKRPLIPAPVPYHDSHTASSPHWSTGT